MVEILLSTALIIAISMAFLCVKVIFRRNGRFSSQHIHDSEAMKERGIHCVMQQDHDIRNTSCRNNANGCAACALQMECNKKQQ